MSRSLGMLVAGEPVEFDPLEKINEISSSLADAVTTAEELQSEAPPGFDTATLADLLRALETARQCVSKLEDQGE